ncbi:hypothetical protein LFYK43_11690 [Ligilactobacillus salitolerans]|uniref:RNA-binding protein KhpB n=1 Tax=Ligilactobacillus salitolerans TaxID=1808352 RepID=A0A401IT39_9LACO|nr:hypothetical protein LFYK43_11690 [Ligilactobacillus salitolerans]
MADLNKAREQVDVQIISSGKKGFLGIGKQLAEVELSVKEDAVKEEKTPLQANTAADAQPEQSKKEDKPLRKAAEPKTQPQAQQPARISHREKEASFDEVLVDLGNYLAEVTKNMGISATISVTPEKHTVYYDFETEQEGLLIGKRGRNLNSLQLLAQDFLDKRIHHRVRVVLDVANYRARRAETLDHLAQKTARDAIAAGEPVMLDPMPAIERKVIHKSLAENKHVKTYSQGTEPRRAVVVDPK